MTQDMPQLRHERADRDAAGRQEDRAALRKARRADLGWLAVGAGIMAATIAALGGLLAVLG